MELVVAVMILTFFLKSLNRKYQLLIPELPGHNFKCKKTNYGLENFTKNIFLLIKKTNMKKNYFFCSFRWWNNSNFTC